MKKLSLENLEISSFVTKTHKIVGGEPYTWSCMLPCATTVSDTDGRNACKQLTNNC